jgi:hypothetical protein
MLFDVNARRLTIASTTVAAATFFSVNNGAENREARDCTQDCAYGAD